MLSGLDTEALDRPRTERAPLVVVSEQTAQRGYLTHRDDDEQDELTG